MLSALLGLLKFSLIAIIIYVTCNANAEKKTLRPKILKTTHQEEAKISDGGDEFQDEAFMALRDHLSSQDPEDSRRLLEQRLEYLRTRGDAPHHGFDGPGSPRFRFDPSFIHRSNFPRRAAFNYEDRIMRRDV